MNAWRAELYKQHPKASDLVTEESKALQLLRLLEMLLQCQSNIVLFLINYLVSFVSLKGFTHVLATGNTHNPSLLTFDAEAHSVAKAGLELYAPFCPWSWGSGFPASAS